LAVCFYSSRLKKIGVNWGSGRLGNLAIAEVSAGGKAVPLVLFVDKEFA